MSYLDIAVKNEKIRTNAYSNALIKLSDYFILLYQNSTISYNREWAKNTLDYNSKNINTIYTHKPFPNLQIFLIFFVCLY